MRERLRRLHGVPRLLLEHLPPEPAGRSLEELADGLASDGVFIDNGQVIGGPVEIAVSRGNDTYAALMAALEPLATAIGPLFACRGTDWQGRPDRVLWGIPREIWPVIQSARQTAEQ